MTKKSPLDYLKEQYKLHPSMQPKDVVKLAFQAAFGAEHLLDEGDLGRVRAYFDDELAEVSATDGLLYEFIADDVCRVNMAVWKKRGLPGDELFDLFVRSASEGRTGGERVFWEYIDAAAGLPFSIEDFVREYKEGGLRAVHHSEEYGAAELPAYRVISGEYTRLIIERGAN